MEQARTTLPTAEQNRDANEKALAEARSELHKTQQEHFARFSAVCPLDNDTASMYGAGSASAAGGKDANGDVLVSLLSVLWITTLRACTVLDPPRQQAAKMPMETSHPPVQTKKPKNFFQQQRELEQRLRQIRGDLGA